MDKPYQTDSLLNGAYLSKKVFSVHPSGQNGPFLVDRSIYGDVKTVHPRHVKETNL